MNDIRLPDVCQEIMAEANNMSPRAEYIELLTARLGDKYRKIADNIALFDSYDTCAQSVMILMERARYENANRWRTSNARRSTQA